MINPTYTRAEIEDLILSKQLDFSHQTIVESDFSNLKLEGCDFRYSILEGCNFKGSNVDNTNFDHAKSIACMF